MATNTRIIAIGTQQVPLGFEALTRAELTRLAGEQQAQIGKMNDVVKQMASVVAQQQLIIDDLAKTMKPTLLGESSITVAGSLVSITAAGTRRQVNPFAGVKPGDFLQPIMSEYLPDGWSLPQLICRNAGQLEVRIGVPQLAVAAASKTVTFGVMALRAVPLTA